MRLANLLLRACCGGCSTAGAAAHHCAQVEATDVAFFSDAGLIRDVYQFRTPVGFERKHVLD